VARWVTPGEFADWKRIGEEEYGFRHVESGPLVRSSYHAKEQAREVEAGGPGKIQEVMEADVPAPAENPSLVGNGAAGAGYAAPGGTAHYVPHDVPRPSKYVPRYLESVPRPENGSSERTNEPSEMNGGARAPALIQLRRQGRSTARAQGTGG
jgi:hypothetical protein